MNSHTANHLSSEELSAFGRGLLASDQTAAAESHVAECQECCQALLSVADDSLIARLRTAVSTSSDGLEACESPTLAPTGPDLSAAVVPLVLPAELAAHPRYCIDKLLGVGGMGAVYRAHHRVMERPVALKIISQHLTTKPGMVERFRREGKTASRLSHPNIVSAFDAEEAGGTHFLVMEYVEGTDLARLVQERGPLPVDRACDYVRQAALGLQHAFEQGMIHRDIKPHNLMLSTDDRVKILDFGLARFAGEAASLGVTAAGMVLGTVDYIAPEQADNARQADIRSDIYSLGCTLYHLLAGRPPFPAGTPIQKVMAHVEKKPQPLTEVRDDIPEGLMHVLECMTAKNPKQRYQTPAEVARALEPFTTANDLVRAPKFRFVERTAEGSRTMLLGLEPFLHRRRRTLVIAAASMLVFVVALLGAAVYRIATDKGEFVVEIDDPQVEVLLARHGLTVRDRKTNREYVLKPGPQKLHSGDYEIKVSEETSGLDFSTKQFRIVRNGREGVKVTFEKVGEARRAQGQKLAPELVRRFEFPDAHVGTIISPDSRYCMGASDRGIRLWDIASGNQVLETTSLADGYLTPDSKHILSHKWEKTVYIVEVATGKESPKFEVPEPTTGLALSPDGKQVALNHSDGTIRLWEYDTGKEIRKLNGRAGPGAVLFSANGKQLLSGGGDKGTAGDRIIRLWDVETGQLIRTFEDFKGVSSWEGHDVVVHCFFLPGERRVAASAWGKDSRLVIWDAATGEMIKEHDLGADFHKAVAVSPGGQWFATAHEDRDRTIRLRDLATGAELLRLTMPEVRIPRGLSFSPDGRYLAAGSYRGWVYVWQLWK